MHERDWRRRIFLGNQCPHDGPSMRKVRVSCKRVESRLATTPHHRNATETIAQEARDAWRAESLPVLGSSPPRVGLGRAGTARRTPAHTAALRVKSDMARPSILTVLATVIWRSASCDHLSALFGGRVTYRRCIVPLCRRRRPRCLFTEQSTSMRSRMIVVRVKRIPRAIRDV